MNTRRPLSVDDLRLCALHAIMLLPLILFFALCNLHTGAPWSTGTGIDESWYVQVSQEMSQSGQWWLPTREGEPFFYKPPLKYWLTSLSAAVLGDSIVAYRIVDAVCGGLIVLIAYGAATAVFASLNAGLFAAVSLLATHGFLFLNGMRFATLDTMVMLLDVVALLIVAHVTLLEREISTREQIKWGGIVGVLVGLAVLTKSVLGYYIVGIYGVWILLTGQLRLIWAKLGRFFAISAAFALAIPALWFLPHSFLTPGAFDVMFGYELVRRFGNKLHNAHNQSLYWDAFVGQRYLPFYTAVAALCALSVRAAVFREKRLALFLVWAIVPFCVFSGLSSRLIWYVAPCYFPAAIVSGGFISWCLDKVIAYVSSFRGVRLLWRAHVVALVCSIGVIFALAETGWYLGRNGLRVWDGSPRLAIDQLVSELKKVRAPLQSFSFHPPAAATRERIFLNMLAPQPVAIKDDAELLKASATSEAYVLFTDLPTAASLVSKLSFVKYQHLPPVTFPQGPKAVYRHDHAFALLGGKYFEDLSSPTFSSRKIVMKPRNDGTQCESIAKDPKRHSNVWVEAEAQHTVVCRFEGDPLLRVLPSSLRLNIGRITLRNDEAAPVLRVHGNQRLLGEIVALRQKPGQYDFAAPPSTWLEGTNSIYLSFASPTGASLAPFSKPAHRLLVRRISVEF